MKKIIALLLFSQGLFAQTGNVGIGTNSPKEKLHIAGGNVLIEDGIVSRSSTGATKDLLPIAIATIGGTGVVTDGTTNVTCVKDGTAFLVDIGEKNTNCQLFLTLLPGVATRYEIFKMTGVNDTKFRILLYNNTTQVNNSFSIVVFKAGNDPLHEYNITVASNVNGLRIGHGFHGIDAFGVDSVTINITINANVMIGGPDPDTTNSAYLGAIVISDIPCPAKITITNFGQIVGRGGRGGRGGSTYQNNSEVTGAICGVSAGQGFGGGDAIITSKKITVINHGFIAGGGGGGGGGKSLATAGSNGGGGGTGAGWPLSAGGQGGANFYGAGALDNCPPGGQVAGCGTLACCCGGYAPFAVNGNGNTRIVNGNQYVAGSGGAGINGGFQGLFGGGLGLQGVSNANTAPGGPPGKVINTTISSSLGSTITNVNGGSYTGLVN